LHTLRRSDQSSGRPCAIVYPASRCRPARIDADPNPGAGGSESATNLANLTGFPDLIVPAGFTTGGLPVHTPALPGEKIGN
jgi:amidase